MKRADLMPYVSFAVDDAQNVRTGEPIPESARLVVYQCGFEPLVVAVWSYLPDVRLSADDAEELARDYLKERNWFSSDRTAADYIV